jgi:chaperonin GroEL
MAKKQILYKEDARNAISQGINELADAVAVTLGPKGQSVRDGVTVAKEIEFEDDPAKDIGARLIREAATKANDRAGDGTTTATVLTRAIINESRRIIAAGGNPREIRRGIEEATHLIIEQIKKQAKPVKDRQQVKQVATVAAGNDETIGEMIADAMDKVGQDGVITVEEAKSLETSLKIVEGMQFEKGFISPYFVTNPERQEVELKDAFVLLCEKKINLVSDLVPILEKVARAGKPLLIIAEDVEGEALATLVVNKLRQVLSVCAVKAPGFGDRRKSILQDIAILSGAEVISEDLGNKLENISADQLGVIDRVLVSKDETTLIVDIPANRKEQIEGRKKQIQREIEESTSDYDKEKLQERLAKLSGGVATIQIGAATETELKDRKLRVEDAVNATKAACAEGIVAGGGVALIRCQAELAKTIEAFEGDKLVGARIVLKAIEAPARQIVENAGQEASIVIQKIKEQKDTNIGYNAALDTYEDMFKAGIVDPAKVTISALQAASSIACMVAETEAVIVEIPDRDRAPAMPAGMGGMDY